MAVLMREYDPQVLVKRISDLNLTDKQLMELTKEHDPDGKGIALMTGRRIKAGQNCKLSVLCLVCYSVGITPESTFNKLR